MTSLEIIDVRNANVTQTSIVYFLDDLGIGLADAAKIADEKHETGMELVSSKRQQAEDDTLNALKRNISLECDVDSIIDDNATRIAEAIYYRTAALIYKELALDSNRYNDVIHYDKGKAAVNMLYLDTSFLTVADLLIDGGVDIAKVKPGRYQTAMENLEPVKQAFEQVCRTNCVGGRYQITIP